MDAIAPKSKLDTRKMVTLSLLAALAYILMLVARVPIVLFLKYDPKDIIITIGGFIYGPMAALTISVVVSVLEMFTVSDTGIIGLIMNVVSTFSFAFTASLIYSKKKTLSGASIGLVAGWLTMVAVMLLWNYLITPLYMVGTSRSDVAAMLIPVFLPFNLLKGGLNAAFTMLLYKPIVTALRKSHLVPESEGRPSGNRRLSLGAMAVSALVLITGILAILVYNNVI